MELKNDILPNDIMRTILFLQPAKSLLRFKAVCKSWNTVISDYDFAKGHLQHSISSKKRNIFLCVPLMSKEYHVAKFENDNFQVETIHEVPKPGKDLLCSGDGLVLLSTSSSKLYLLWNPCTKQKTKITCNYKFNLEKTTFGISRGPSLDDYKIVAKCSNYYTVFSCKYNAWSEKKEFPFIIDVIKQGWHDAYWLERKRYDTLYGRGLLIDGFSFWVMVERAGRIPGIFYFDPRDEEFKKLQKPAELETESNKTIVLTSLRGCLCVSYDFVNHEPQLRTWILRDNNVDSNSWSELTLIEDVTEIDGLPSWNTVTPLFFTEKNELVIRSGVVKRENGTINSMEKKFEELDFSEPSIFDHDSITVPCLDTIFFPRSIEGPRNYDTVQSKFTDNKRINQVVDEIEAQEKERECETRACRFPQRFDEFIMS